jgi:hypothetical protein
MPRRALLSTLVLLSFIAIGVFLGMTPASQ